MFTLWAPVVNGVITLAVAVALVDLGVTWLTRGGRAAADDSGRWEDA